MPWNILIIKAETFWCYSRISDIIVQPHKVPVHITYYAYNYQWGTFLLHINASIGCCSIFCIMFVFLQAFSTSLHITDLTSPQHYYVSYFCSSHPFVWIFSFLFQFLLNMWAGSSTANSTQNIHQDSSMRFFHETQSTGLEKRFSTLTVDVKVFPFKVGSYPNVPCPELVMMRTGNCFKRNQ